MSWALIRLSLMPSGFTAVARTRYVVCSSRPSRVQVVVAGGATTGEQSTLRQAARPPATGQTSILYLPQGSPMAGGVTTTVALRGPAGWARTLGALHT